MVGHDAAHTGRGAGVVLTTPKIAWTLPLPNHEGGTELVVDKLGDSVFSTSAFTDSDITSLSAQGAVSWSVPMGHYEGSGPLAIAEDGTLYYAWQGALGYGPSALVARRRDGSKKWRRTFNETLTAPTIGSSGTVYFGDVGGGVHAQLANGTEQWLTTIPGVGITVAPSVAPAGAIRVAGAPTSGTAGGTLASLSSAGALEWMVTLDDMPLASPVVAPDGTTYVLTRSGMLHVVRSNGTLAWQHDYGTMFVGTPRLASDGSIIAHSFKLVGTLTPTEGRLIALRPDGSTKWTVEAGSGALFGALLLLDDGTVYAATGNAFGAWNASGAKLWTLPVTGGVSFASAGPSGSVLLQTRVNNTLNIVSITN